MPIRWTQKFALVALLALGLAVAATVAILIVVRFDAREARQSLQDQQATIVKMQELLIGKTFARQAHGLLYLSLKRNVHALVEGDAGQLTQVEQDFVAFLVEHPDYRSIALIDSDRQLVVNFERTRTGATFHVVPYSPVVLNRDYVREGMAMAAGKVYVSRLLQISEHTSSSGTRASIWFVTPLVDDKGLTHGVIAVDFEADQLLREIGQLNSTTIGRLLVLDNTGAITFDSDRSKGADAIARGNSAARNSIDRRLIEWARQNGTTQSELNQLLLTQLKLCASASSCDEGDATKLAFLPKDQPWRLLRVIRPGPGYDLGLLGARYRPFITIYFVLLSLLAIGTFFGIWLFAALRKLQRHEVQLRRSSALLEAFVDNNPVSIFIKDRTGRYLFVNRAKAARFNREVKDLLGHTDTEFHPAEQAARLHAEDAQILAINAPKEFTHKLNVPTGERYYASFKFPLPDPESGQQNIATIETDITERVVAEADAEHHAGILAATYDAAPDGILTFDGEWRIETVNATALRIFGYSREQMLGAQADMLISKDRREDFVRLCHNLLNNPALLSDPAIQQMDESEGLTKDGRIFPLELSLGRVVLRGRCFVVCILRDVTRRKQMEEQLQRSQKMESIGQLTGGLAHDFNNLLGVILGNLDLLERSLTSDDAALKRIHAAQRAAERGADLNVRLLAFSRRQPLKPQPNAVNSLLLELVAMLPQTLGPDIRIVNKLGKELPPVLIDAGGFESALLNLAINARDAMPTGGTLTFTSRLIDLGSDHAAVVGADVLPGTYILVSVSDTGQGIAPEYLQRVFEPFFTTKPRGKGNGLGLAMVYGYIKQSGGHATIYSEVGRGTTVNLYLPIAKDAILEEGSGTGDPFSSFETNKRHTKHTKGYGTVLVVDDEVGLLEVTVTYLEEHGYRVLDAVDGPSALEICAEEERIDLLLTDVVMPGYMNGVELARAVRGRHPAIAVIYMSGFPSSALTVRTGMPVDAPVISKPFSREALLDLVQSQIGGGPGVDP